MPSPGDLRERVAFEYRQDHDDGAGNTLGAFTEAFSRAAQIRPARGREMIEAARLQGVSVVFIAVRFDSETRSVDTDWRIRDVRTGIVYNIRDAGNQDMRRRFIEFRCEAGVAT